MRQPYYGGWETADLRRGRAPGRSYKHKVTTAMGYIEWLGTAPATEIMREANRSGDPVAWLKRNLSALDRIRRGLDDDGRKPSRPSPVVVRPSARDERLHRLLRVS